MQSPTDLQPSWGFLILGAAALLAIVGMAIGIAVFLRGRRLQRHHVRRVASIMLGWFWMVPLAAVVAVIGLYAFRQFPHEVRTLRAERVSAEAIILAERAPAGEAALGSASSVDLPLPGEPHLKARQMSSDAPDWVAHPAFAAGGGSLIALSSERFATLDDAERQVTAQAVEAIRNHFHEEFPDYGAWTVPVSLIEQHAVQQSAYEVIDQDFGGGFREKMYRAHVQLKFSPELRQALYGTWRAGIVEHRLLVLASLFGLVTLILGTIAGYIRLDALSLGAYSRRLKFAAGLLIAAGSLIAAQLVR